MENPDKIDFQELEITIGKEKIIDLEQLKTWMKENYNFKYLSEKKGVKINSHSNDPHLNNLVKWYRLVDTFSQQTPERPFPNKDLADNLMFGRYKGNKVNDIIEIDPNYIIWCIIKYDYFLVNTCKTKYDVTVLEKLKSIFHTLYKQEPDSFESKVLAKTEYINIIKENLFFAFFHLEDEESSRGYNEEYKNFRDDDAYGFNARDAFDSDEDYFIWLNC